MRSHILLILVFFGLLLPHSHAAERNIVLFVADDLSPDAGCYGNMVIQTPHIDAFARDATVFTHAFATTASCSASRSVILTGLHNHTNGHYGHLHAYHKFSSFAWVKSLPVLLQKRGYRTARIGKYHVGPEDVYSFQQVLDADDRDPVAMAEECEPLFATNSEKPFFLLFATADPHRGGGFAQEIPTHPNRFGNQNSSETTVERQEKKYTPQEVLVPPFLPDSPESRAELAQYYQSATRVDQGLGRLIELLQQTGRWKDTLLVFTSDHGMAFAGAKTTVYEPGLHVPLIVRNPYEPNRATRNQALVSLLDVAPTLLDFAGGLDRKTGEIIGLETPMEKWQLTIDVAEKNKTFESGKMQKVPYRFHGRSFLSILDQPKPTGWDHVTASHSFHEVQMYYPMRVYRDRKYKLIWNLAHELPYPFASDLWTSPTWQAQWKAGSKSMYGQRTVDQFIHRPAFEFYDIQQDPWEKDNLSDRDEYASVLAKYKDKLKTFQIETGDPWALKWFYD